MKIDRKCHGLKRGRFHSLSTLSRVGSRKVCPETKAHGLDARPRFDNLLLNNATSHLIPCIPGRRQDWIETGGGGSAGFLILAINLGLLEESFETFLFRIEGSTTKASSGSL